MAFRISRSQSAFTEREKENIVDHIGEKGSATVGSISSELQLKSTSKASSHQTLDKHVVLRRIKQRKSNNKAKSAFQALLGNSEANTAQEQKWLQLGDAFSSP
ncbi:hypothetical protein SESBI_45514 [Sesbania bispinosa]|nr:hypothetical protein SESBI_45514 [Sesbania bispinosa]